MKILEVYFIPICGLLMELLRHCLYSFIKYLRSWAQLLNLTELENTIGFPFVYALFKHKEEADYQKNFEVIFEKTCTLQIQDEVVRKFFHLVSHLLYGTNTTLLHRGQQELTIFQKGAITDFKQCWEINIQVLMPA